MVILTYIRRSLCFVSLIFLARLPTKKRTVGLSSSLRVCALCVCLFIVRFLMYVPVNLWCANTHTPNLLCVFYFRNKTKLKKGGLDISKSAYDFSVRIHDFFVCVLVSVRWFVYWWASERVSVSIRMSDTLNSQQRTARRHSHARKRHKWLELRRNFRF